MSLIRISKKRRICSYSWQIAKTKNISREMSTFIKNKIRKNIFKKKIQLFKTHQGRK